MQIDFQSIHQYLQDIKISNATVFLFGSYLTARIFKYAYWKVKNHKLHSNARQIIQEKTKNFSEQIFDISNIKNVDFILSLDVKGLRNELIKGTFTSTDLVNLFGHRCQKIGKKLNLAAEENFHQAFQLAKEKDEQLKQAKLKGQEELDKLGLLHGIPFSVKDLIDQKGKLSTLGCAFLCDDVREQDAVIVQLFLKAGGIPIIRGSCPQTGLSIHTSNLLFGEAMNPHNNQRSCGGSSGGDAGLIAARCVPISLGTDIGGSLRFPASFCGIYGFKPSQGRVSRLGNSPARKIRFSGYLHLTATAGPMGSSVQDLITCMEILLDKDINLYDPFQIPSSWRQDKFLGSLITNQNSKIKIGVLQESEFLSVSDSVRRAMKISEDSLKALGYEVVPFVISRQMWKEFREIFMSLIANGPSKNIMKDISSQCETLMKPLQSSIMIQKAGPVQRYFIDIALRNLLNKKRVQEQLNGLRQLEPDDFEKFLKYRNQFVRDFSQKWRESGITALVSPIQPHCAIKSQDAEDAGLLLEYAALWNVTGFPCGVLPITKVLENEQSFDDIYKDSWTKTINSTCQNSKDLPVGIQVIGYAFEDEEVLAVMHNLEKKVRFEISTQVNNFD